MSESPPRTPPAFRPGRGCPPPPLGLAQLASSTVSWPPCLQRNAAGSDARGGGIHQGDHLLYVLSAEGLLRVMFIKSVPWLSKYGRHKFKSGRIGAFKWRLHRHANPGCFPSRPDLRNVVQGESPKLLAQGIKAAV